MLPKPLNRGKATRMPSLRIVQALDTIETPNGRIITGQLSVKTVKAIVTLGPSSFCWRRFRIRIFRVVAGLKAKLPQDFLRVHTADELDFFANQLQQDVCALRTDCR